MPIPVFSLQLQPPQSVYRWTVPLQSIIIVFLHVSMWPAGSWPLLSHTERLIPDLFIFKATLPLWQLVKWRSETRLITALHLQAMDGSEPATIYYNKYSIPFSPWGSCLQPPAWPALVFALKYDGIVLRWRTVALLLASRLLVGGYVALWERRHHPAPSDRGRKRNKNKVLKKKLCHV